MDGCSRCTPIRSHPHGLAHAEAAAVAAAVATAEAAAAATHPCSGHCAHADVAAMPRPVAIPAWRPSSTRAHESCQIFRTQCRVRRSAVALLASRRRLRCHHCHRNRRQIMIRNVVARCQRRWNRRHQFAAPRFPRAVCRDIASKFALSSHIEAGQSQRRSGSCAAMRSRWSTPHRSHRTRVGRRAPFIRRDIACAVCSSGLFVCV